MQDQSRRLRSTAVSLGLVGALALSLSACGTSSTSSATRRCIDANNIRQTDSAYQIVGDDQCLVSPAPSTAGGFGTTPSYRYYYGGLVTSGYVSGGSFTVPTTSRSSSSRSRTWYNPGTWRSSSNSSGTSSASSGSSSSTKSGVSTGGFGSSGSSGGKSSGS